jgi:hypothetical protein
MTGKPKDPTREYSPNWGGANRNQRKPKSGYDSRLVTLHLDKETSHEEYRAIMALTPRQRAQAILKFIQENHVI